MKVKNRKMILNLIRQREISRAEISKITGLSKPSVSYIIDELSAAKIVFERGARTGKIGRSPIILSLDENAFFIPCANITRKFADVGILNWAGGEVAAKRLAVSTPERTIAQVARELKKMMAASGIDGKKFLDAGLTSPGPVDTEKGAVLNATNFEGWQNADIAARLEKKLGKKVVFDNVSNGSALGEFYFGAAKNVANFLDIMVDEGIGAGAVVDGRLFPKMNEWGHTTIKFDGKKCPCGNTGCLEVYAATGAITRGTKYKSWRQVVDARANGIIRREAKYLAAGITSALNVFDFDMVVLSSEISYKPGALLGFVREFAKKTLSGKKVEIIAAAEKSGLCPPAAVSLHKFFTAEA